jgi:hypothetical protein
MFKKIYQPILAVAIAHLLFILSISPTWAATYSDSVIIKSNDKLNERKATLVLVERDIKIKVNQHAVESYLEDYNLNEIELKVEMTETLVSNSDDGNEDEIYYLDFTFSPPGCYFDKNLELKIDGEYKKTGYSALLSNSMGDTIGYDEHGDKFKIDDFGQVDDSYFDKWFWAASYYGSVVVEKGKGGKITLNAEAGIKIKNKSVDDYLDKMEIDSVEITVEMYYGWDGSIWFVFGPSGTFFTPNELELTIAGGYLEKDMILLGEDGEFLEYKINKKQNSLTFFVPHFSNYYYEEY